MFEKYYTNQNHAVHRSSDQRRKVASIYAEQAISNRVEEEKPLTFSELAPYEAQSIMEVMKKDAATLEEMGITKRAIHFVSPFDQFKTAKNMIARKLGIGDEVAHDLASNVIGKAHNIHGEVGGDIEPIITGIVENIDMNEIHQRIGAIPMKNQSQQKVEEHVKLRLMEEMQLSAFQANQIAKNVMAEVKNLSTRFRNKSTEEIAGAIVDVIVNYQDTSIVYGISSNSMILSQLEQSLR